MEKQRFIETGNSSFFGEYLYDPVVPADHFLRQMIRPASPARQGKLKPVNAAFTC